jgi:hypothetical protein
MHGCSRTYLNSCVVNAVHLSDDKAAAIEAHTAQHAAAHLHNHARCTVWQLHIIVEAALLADASKLPEEADGLTRLQQADDISIVNTRDVEGECY